jgi:ABC-type branched-subunit amino acid transport system substrate-binding protein
VSRWFAPRFLAPVAALAAILALAGCGSAPEPEPIVPTPAARTQPPLPVAPPSAEMAGLNKVALLVPLSGPNADLGKAILDAAQLALFEAGGDKLALVPRDTAGTADGAAAAAKAAVADGARLILGPLLASEVEAVKPIAAEAHLEVIAFSTVTDLAGDNTFLMGFLPRPEVVREVAFARQQGLLRFAALAPDTPYGRLMVDALNEVAGSNGASVVKTEFFNPNGSDVAAQIQQLLPQTAGPGAAPDFGALLLPEGGARLHQVAQQLQGAGIDRPQVRLLGSGLWDVPDIGKDPALDGGWFAASSPAARRAFDAHFAATYGHPAPRLASLGFDAAALAAVLAQGQGGAPFSREAILNPRGFVGVDGVFRFTPGGLVQRGLAVLEVRPQGNVVASPAPKGFEDLAY